MKFAPPGTYVPCHDAWLPFADAWARLRQPALVVADARVLRLHPHVGATIRGTPYVALRAGEGVKSLRTLQRLAQASLQLPRDATVVAIGGGTIGDVATVFAHLHKRGTRLIHVPTTVLAAVDSSVGGKGAVNVGAVKNALGVFHAPLEGWLCPELFTTLKPAQHREGEAEAWKMALTLDVHVWKRWEQRAPDLQAMISTSRRLKSAVCQEDPYEQTGRRAVLNFGHTLGHVIESLTRYRVRHGEAVALGMLCALDVGRAVGVTPPAVAEAVEAALPFNQRARERLHNVLSSSASTAAVRTLLRSDKKGASTTHTRFVLLKEPGLCELLDVSHRDWEPLLTCWKKGKRP